MVWMFQIKIHLKKMLNNIVIIVELIYPILFHPISPFMGLGVREWWVFSLSLKGG